LSDAVPSRPFPGTPPQWLGDLRLAAGFLTRLVPPPSGVIRPLAQAVRAFPLVGAGLGIGAGLVYILASGSGLPPMLAALVTLTALVLATGALHEDGLADTADGFGGGASKATKLAIMRDSRIGTYGVIAVAFSLMARVAGLATIAEPALVFAALVATGAASRAAMPLIMVFLPMARSDGLGADAGRPSRRDTVIGGVLALVIALFTLDGAAIVVTLVVGGLAALTVAALARRQIGGYTGDVLGAAQQISEVAMLFTIVAML
jgi:adenosylcobinamide-GDP ribazoletransferase